MFTGAINLYPGQELREFKVLRTKNRETERGRIVSAGEGEEKTLGTIKAVLAAAKPSETERWRQLEHPVTHKIIQYGASGFEIRPGDVFEREGRRFYNQTLPYNIGGLNHWTIYYCDERTDVT
jgi:hypothetical protein